MIKDGLVDEVKRLREIYPLNILEIKFQIRKNNIENHLTNLDLNPEYLIQVHTWF